MFAQPLQLGSRQLGCIFNCRDAIFAVDIQRVKAEPIGNQNILKAIEIHIHERCGPRPVGRLEPGVVGRLQPGAVSP